MKTRTSLTTVTLNDKELDALRATEDILQYIADLVHDNNIEILDDKLNDLSALVDSIYGGACVILEHYKIDNEV